MSDNLHVVWGKFFNHRTRVLWDRFPGIYRALVVETNDPLCMYRVRVKCPDMHDFDLDPEDCPWAVPSHEMGGGHSGRFTHPCIGDWVWITFERQHPYAPVWIGFANPTRRKIYAYPQIFGITPVSVNDSGKPNLGDLKKKNKDYDPQYLPADGRPMMHGWQDRYGNLDIHSSVGFYPTVHENPPPAPDYDAVQSARFSARRRAPQANSPDKKYMSRVTKYGNMVTMADQGYYWQNEFKGDHTADERFERKRWLYLQKLLNENRPRSSNAKTGEPVQYGDQRRIVTMTRYGHRIECRDVGWAQAGPIASTSRAGEYGKPVQLSNEQKNDFRWIKIRTKGGMLFQAYDKGADPAQDVFIKRSLLKEQAHLSEQEHLYWAKKDARWIRIVTRHGLKLVLDDRGTDTKRAHKIERYRANGVLIKGRRSPGAKKRPARGNPRGFYWEFNENDEANHTSWGTPMGLSIEMNDRYQYMMLTASLGKKWGKKYRGLKENEFIGKPTMMRNPERTSHHLKIDHDNEYIRLKTRAGKGPKPEQRANPSALRKSDAHQGLEIHDGRKGDGPWVELVDCDHRGLWMSRRHQLTVMRSKKKRKMYMYMEDRQKRIVIYHDESTGGIILYSKANIQIKAGGDLLVDAGHSMTFRAKEIIAFQTNAAAMTLSNGLYTSGVVNAQRVNAILTNAKPGNGAGASAAGGLRFNFFNKPVLPKMIEPTDRAKTYNEPFEVCPKDEIEHPIK